MQAAHKKFVYLALAAILFFLTIEISLRLAGMAHLYWIRSSQNTIPAAQGNTLNLLFLGESTTAWGMLDSYPSTLGRLIQEKYPQIPVRIINAAVPASNTELILRDLDALVDQYHPDLVFTMMGINDFWSIQADPNSFRAFWLNLRIVKLVSKLYSFLSSPLKEPLLQEQATSLKSYPPDPLRLTAEEQNIFTAANRAFEEKKFEEAQSLLAPLLKKPMPSSVLLLEGKLALRLQNKAVALRIFNQVAEQSKNPEWVSQIAHDYILHYGEADPEIRKIIRRFSEKALSLDNEHAFSHLTIGCLINQAPNGEEKVGIDHLNEAEKLGLINSDLYLCRAALQMRLGNYEDAIQSFKKAKNIDGISRIHAFTGLIKLYLEKNLQKEAKAALKEAQEAFPNNIVLARYHNELYKNSAKANYDYYNFLENPVTQKNYRAIANRLLERKIKMIAVQYPVISIEPLPKILENLPVPIVSNQENFAQALKTQSFNQLFTDNFAQRFGHFSAKGSQIVAEAVLLKLEELNLLSAPKSDK